MKVPAINVERFPDLESMSRRAAGFVRAFARECARERGRFCLALSGGRTPRRLYELLADSPLREEMPWACTHLFWTDERCVARESQDSNYRLALETFLSRVPIPVENIHPMPSNTASREAAARAYELSLRSFFAGSSATFDLILLGVGSDGHTASLFPDDKSLAERERWVLAVEGVRASPPVPRLTLSLAAIDAARAALFLSCGEEKRRFSDLMEEGRALPDFPALLVRPMEALDWYWAPG
ncbi:MAG: 6-phosphogluconolactonase [Elusimicrobia bacterium]|nr:6-phosphogluconolactonase [Elusimicrobiota bacterium]